MLRGGNVKEIVELKQSGLSISLIADETGYDRKTIRKYLKDPGAVLREVHRQRGSKLDPHKEYLNERLQAGVWNGRVLLRELRGRGYDGGYSILLEYLQPLRQSVKQVAVRRFETAPGQQAQVDWGHLGTLETEEGACKLSAFVMTLGYSRALFAEVTCDETLPTLLKMHEAAFEEWGGVCQEILYDRPKTIVLGVDERREVVWNPGFLDFARYWGFTPRLCQGYRPQTKGKVEAGVKYLRGNFLCGREASSLKDLQNQLRAWVQSVANARVHGTTHQVVAQRLLNEQPHLSPVGPRAAYPLEEDLRLFEKRRVARDCYISWGANRYSVPHTAVGQEVAVREVSGQLEVKLEGLRLAQHALCPDKHQVITIASHVAGIPLGSSQRPQAKNLIHVVEGAPEVEVRSLALYDTLYDLDLYDTEYATDYATEYGTEHEVVMQNPVLTPGVFHD